LALLVGMLVVGVVYRNETVFGRVVETAKSSSSVDTQVVHISDAAHYIDPSASPSQLVGLVLVDRGLHPKQDGIGLSGSNGEWFYGATVPFIERNLRKWAFRYKNLTVGVPYLGAGAAAINRIKLAGRRIARDENNSPDSFGIRKVKITHYDAGALRKNDLLFHDDGLFFDVISLLLHDLSLSVQGRNRFSQIQNLESGHENKQSCKDNESFIPPILIRLDREWGGGHFYQSGFIIGCYLLTLALIPIGGLSGDRGRKCIGRFLIGVGFACGLVGTFALGCPWFTSSTNDNCENQRDYQSPVHGSNTVPRKYLLTNTNYWGTVIGIGRTEMPNVLSTDKQVAVISALAEGSGIRQIERITGVHRDTIMRLGVRVGKGCANILDRKMRDLSCNHLQFDEIWGFIGKKERHCTPDDSPEVGDVWTFCAIDSDTKIVPSFRVGKRDSATANAFVADVASRLRNRVQISSDALRAYVEAVEMAFGANVDFAQIVKTYTRDESRQPERQYSAPEFVIEEKKRVCGMPDMGIASTSHIERLNGTTRLHMRRLTRLTYAFSKKRENFEAAVALHFAYYNFVKRHNTLRCTPAMAAGIERDFWTVRDLVEAVA